MALKSILKEIDDIKTAIETTEVLVTEHNHTVLLPTLNYLKEQKKALSVKVSQAHLSINVQYEEVNRLSHI